jgi:hypothetical protein
MLSSDNMGLELLDPTFLSLTIRRAQIHVDPTSCQTQPP